MRNLSQEFIEKQNNGYRNYLKFADITLADGTILHLENANFWQNGFSFEDSISGDNSFDIGSATINKFTLVINNIYDEFTKCVFTGAKAVCYIGLEVSTGIEKIRICTGTVAEEPKQKSSIITLSFYDNMEKFDKDYSGVKTVFPATRNQIVRDICSYCDVTLQTLNFDRDDYIIQERPTDEALTCRQMLSWIAQIGCQWAKCDAYGRLCLEWYKNVIPGNIKTDSNGTLSTYEGDKVVHLFISENGVVTPETGYFRSENGNLSFISQNDYENRVYKTQNLTVNLDDIVITGVRVTEFVENTTEEKANTYLYGEEGYVLLISNNKLIRKGMGQTIASMIGKKCVGMRFRPFSTSCLTDIAMESGDSVLITDKNGVSYQSYITSVTLNPGNFESISCSAEPAQRNNSKRYTYLEQTRVELNKNIQKEKTDREQALEEFSDRLSNAPGVFTTVQTDTGGGKIFYLHNKPKLSESDIVWKMTAEAWAVSTDGGKTWNGGMTVDGDTIVRILTATGVNADWINAGAITVRDSNQNIIFSVDMDTKRVIISGDSVQIGGRPVQDVINSGITESKNYSDKKLSDYANTVTKDLENLQSQVDGQVEDYYYDYEPSMQNIPASQWTTTEERQKHIGDRFFWKSKGYAYRFMEDNGVWGWVLLQDTDITKAMQTAQNAKDIADGKRRTFVTTPKPPYDIGDLWTNGVDILTCTVSRESGSSYVSSDWKKQNTYTDDTVANQALEEAKKAHNLIMSLGNEYQGIPADYNGNIVSPFPIVKTGVTVYYGHTDVSKNCSYSVQKSASVTGSWNNTNREYTVTNLSADTGWVDITATYLGSLTVTKRFNVAKNKGGKPGTSGTSVTIKSKSVTYSVGTSGTVKPTGEWSETIPQVPAGQYLWAKTYVEYSNGEHTETYSVSYKAKDGENGKPGTNGTSVTITSKSVMYQVSTNGTIPPTGQWKESIPSVPTGQYLWTRTIVNYSNGTSTTSYSVGYQGTNGANGSPGRTYFIESSSNVLKRTKDSTISPNFIEFKSYYRDGNSIIRTPYNGRFVIEETSDGNTWNTIYESNSDENTVKHYLYTMLKTSEGQNISTGNGSTIGIPRDITSVRCKLYASGGTSNLMDMQSVAVVVDVDNLTHEEIFNLLTNNGEIKGIYKEGEQLYISFTYAKGGILHLGGVNNGNGALQVFDKNGKIQCQIDNTSINLAQGNIVLNMDGSFIAKNATIAGQLKAATGTFAGQLEAATGTFAGQLKAATGTFAGQLKAATGTFNGQLEAATGTFAGKISSKRYYDNFTKEAYINYGELGFLFNGDKFLSISTYPKTDFFDIPVTYITYTNGEVIFNKQKGNESITTLALDEVAASVQRLSFGYNMDLWPSVSGNSIVCGSGFHVNKDFKCSGTKSRFVKTKSYDKRLLYCYETPSPMFGDIGEAQTDESGICYIYLDDIFQETINTDIEYQVFLQKEGQGDLWVDLKESAYFIVKGTPKLKFAWEIKAKQKDFEYYRLEDSETTEYDIKNIDYETQGQKLFENYLLEKENQYEESN